MTEPQTLSEHAQARVPTPLGQRIERYPETAQVFRRARRTFIAESRIDMGALAAQHGIDRTSLFRWVGNRDNLLTEVLWSLAAPTLEAADRATSGTGAHRIASIMERFTEQLVDAQYFRVFLRREPARALRLLTRTDSILHRRFAAAIAALIAEETQAGRFDPAPFEPARLARLLVRISESITYTDLISGETPDITYAGTTFAYVLRPSASTVR